MIARVKIDKSGGNYFANPKTNLKFIPSGCKVLDLTLGGGWCEDRIANIVGDKSTGKTLLCIEASANFAFLNPKGKIRYREAEAAFDQPYAKALGMPVDRIDFGEPLETVEDLFEDLTKIVEGAKSKELVIVDSLDALSDRSEMERDMDQGSYGAEKAKKLSQLFRRLVRQMADKNVTLIIVSQVRDKIGVSFGRSTTRSGGKALDFYASQVVYLAHVGRITKTISSLKRVTGVKVLAKIDKNKVGLPFREASFSIRFGYGIDDAQACLDWLAEVGALKEVGISEKDSKFYLQEIMEMTPQEGAEEIERFREVVQRKWYEVEGKLLTPRSKYGAGA
jgi:recombination protein RecA